MTDPRTEDIKGHCPECEAGLAALRAAFDAANDRPEPIAQWEDPRVQAVYEVIAFCDTPPPEYHWEGWTARRIVDRLAALEQPEQEPVATVAMDVSRAHLSWDGKYLGQKPDMKIAMLLKDLPVGTLLFTHPHRREWRGLTEEENNELSHTMVKGHKSVNWLASAIEAALKERNV